MPQSGACHRGEAEDGMRAVAVSLLLLAAAPGLAAAPSETAPQDQEDAAHIPLQAWRACVIDAAVKASRVEGMPSLESAVEVADKLCWASRRPVRDALPATLRKMMTAQGVKHYGADVEDEMVAEAVNDMAHKIRELALAIISRPDVTTQYRR